MVTCMLLSGFFFATEFPSIDFSFFCMISFDILQLFFLTNELFQACIDKQNKQKQNESFHQFLSCLFM